MFRVGKSKLKALAAAATLAAPTVSMAQISATWTWNQAIGTYNDALNWTSAVGNSFAQAGGIATLPVTSVSGSLSSVVLVNNVTLGGLQFTGNFNTGNKTYYLQGSGGQINLNGGSTIQVDSGSVNIGATINATSATQLIFKTGAGTLNLTGANTFTTGLTINGGTVRASTANALRGNIAISTANNGALELLNMGALSPAIVSIGSNPTGGAIHSISAVSGTTPTLNVFTGNWFLLTTSSINTDTGSGISIAGTINDTDDSGINGLTKIGGGSLSLNGVNLNGILNVNAGTMNMTGASTMRSLNVSGGTVNFAGGLTINNASVDAPGTPVVVAVNNSASLFSLGAHLNGNTTVTAGNMAVVAGGTLNGVTTVSGTSTLTANAGNTSVANLINMNGGTAIFGAAFTNRGSVVVSGATVTYNQGTHSGNLTMNSGVLNINGGTHSGAVSILGGTSTVTGGTFTQGITKSAGTLTFAPGVVVGDANLSGGTTTINAGTFTGNIVNSTGTLTTLSKPVINGSLTNSSGTTVFGGATINGSLFVTGGTVRLNQGASANLVANKVTVKGLTISAGASLNMTNNTMVVDYTGQANLTPKVRQYLIAGFNNGDWNGTGGISDLLANGAGYPRALGYYDNALFGDGINPASSVVIKHTWYGDADLTGTVDADDITQFVDGFNGVGSGWLYADFDYSGATDADDLTLLLDGFGAQGGILSPALAQSFTSIIDGSTIDAADKQSLDGIILNAVPEPGTLGVLALSAGFVAGRRRRRVIG